MGQGQGGMAPFASPCSPAHWAARKGGASSHTRWRSPTARQAGLPPASRGSSCRAAGIPPSTSVSLKPQQATTGLTALPQVEGEATRHNVTGPSKEPFSQRCSIRPDTAYRPSACCLPTNLARSQGELSPGLARAPARPRSGVPNGTEHSPRPCVCLPPSLSQMPLASES